MVGVVCINREVVSGMVCRSFRGVILWRCALVIHRVSGVFVVAVVAVIDDDVG